MFSVKSLTAAALCLLSSAGLASGQANTPAAPGLTYLYSLNCTLGTAITVGGGPHGSRVVIPITGGSFSGPRLSGALPWPSPEVSG